MIITCEKKINIQNVVEIGNSASGHTVRIGGIGEKTHRNSGKNHTVIIMNFLGNKQYHKVTPIMTISFSFEFESL